MSLHADVHKILNSVQQAREDGRVDLRELASIASQLLTAGLSAGRNLTGNDQEYQAFREEIAAAYDHDVAPLDIPHVPNILEGYIDEALKSLLLLALDRTRKAIA